MEIAAPMSLNRALYLATTSLSSSWRSAGVVRAYGRKSVTRGSHRRVDIAGIAERDLADRLLGCGIDDIQRRAASRIDPFAIDVKLSGPVGNHNALPISRLCLGWPRVCPRNRAQQ